MSEIKVNKISPKTACGTTTLGDSGDTFTIPAGVTITNNGTQSGFGRTGAVDWQTSIKAADFTAANGEGYFLDTTGGTISVNLPAGTAGAVVAFKDYANNFNNNAVTLVQNGSDKIGSSTVNATLSVAGIAVTLVFIDSTQGWLVTDSGLQSEAPTVRYVIATGGTVATCGDFKVHTFTGPGTFCVSSVGNPAGSDSVEYAVVAGGGGAGGSQGGGGGAGGFRFASPSLAPATYPAKPLAAPANVPVTATSFPITVGGGGAGAATGPGPNGTSGNNSTFSSITSTGGGGGGTAGSPTSGPNASNPTPGAGYAEGLPGGSGGGTRGTYINPGSPNPANHYYNPGGVNVISNGNTPPVSPSQGNRGGGGYDANSQDSTGGGGGGATAVGSSGRGPGGQGTSNAAGPGGAGAGLPTAFGATNGVANPSPDAFRYYAGGGGGGTNVCAPTPGGTGGLGGGGAGNGNPGGSCAGGSGTTNTGGGGGAGAGNAGGAGGSGIVIIRYKFQN